MAKNSGLSKVFQSVKNYFDLGFQPEDKSEEKFNFVIEGKVTKPTGAGQHIRNYFDLHSAYRPAARVMRDVLTLIDGKDGTQFVEMKPKADGIVLIACDAAFAEKVKALHSVVSVREASATDAPKAPTPPAA